MLTACIRFQMPPGTDWEQLTAVARDRAETLYRNIPGLRDKSFIISRERSEYGGVYTWEDRPSLDAFLASDVFTAAKAKFGTPAIEVFEVAARVERGNPVNVAPVGG
ncbi:MAG: YdhR family protein [Dehalococcoidia bacterium]